MEGRYFSTSVRHILSFNTIFRLKVGSSTYFWASLLLISFCAKHAFQNVFVLQILGLVGDLNFFGQCHIISSTVRGQHTLIHSSTNIIILVNKYVVLLYLLC
jgi:hypothetical protein